MPAHNGNNTASQLENDLNPNRGVLQDMLPATTLEGKQRQRMRWSDEVNRHLMFCYYQATNLGTNTTGYRSQVYTTFITRYPELKFLTEQRLADQIRVIIKNNRIPQSELENIKQQVQQILEQKYVQSEEEENTVMDSNIPEQTNKDQHASIKQSEENEILTQPPEQAQIEHEETHVLDIEEKFQLTYIEYKDTNTDIRPFWHRPPNNPQVETTIKTINTIIHNKINENTTMEELQLLVYIGALTTLNIHTRQRSEQTNTHKKPTKPAWQHRLFFCGFRAHNFNGH
ncbi:uncharacterized protein LOC126185107 [Schistocerca cancellata]|uniref:uncharacterized protein LOC126185107 n=1 Tax=Schistocerca cancellata TaxID=274614 RepID=UPI0021181F6B|nr:uncharacterized protein LOC126185107 [Schistocerca cancellata]